MNDSIKIYIEKLKNYWTSRSKRQKTLTIGAFLFLILVIAVASYFATRTTMVPLYSNLSPSETGTIKQSLDQKGITSQIADSGTTIMVPEKSADTLKVQLAAEGLPKSGSIDYSFFSQNAGLGTTDKEFSVIKLDAMQTELANLIKGIEGVQDAKVMINLPEKGIFVSDDKEAASASIVLNTKPGYQFRDEQIRSLYQLVSKSVPNLPTDNIVIMNQYFEYFDLNKENNSNPGSSFTAQAEIKKQVERDIQRQVQSMLGTLMGQDKVVVSVTADMDFTQENREENLVEPVDKENMKGIAISAQKITETYTGKGANAVGGTPAAENPADTQGSTYAQGSTNGDGDYEKVDDKVNYEVNRIKKQISESPYKIRDLGIQVMVEPPKPNDPNSLPQARVDDISKMLGSIVRTSIDKKEGTDLTDAAIQNKILVSVQPFNGKIKFSEEAQQTIPWWVYAAGGVLLLIIVLLLILFLRSRKKRQEEEEMLPYTEPEPVYIPDVNNEHDTEATVRRKQLEKMAKEKPEEFAKLLRTWIAED
ncbi:flagellar basal-body MS-ring/collar protein FliF [Neobacillus terrae]|uniref:flagellar basal-body MS-ring/collar protein FliF n=1 Tax=Neobacillus terrae TaxID=3034837 RepID=UPI001409028B|nr:flagellar basal-body MS-ring/collar protein FliF [Neobacillus terrae]NHM29791.1 flagellar basal body M-ring protein FliF [Neobacillus terrae]